MGDLFGEEREEQRLIGPLLLLGTLNEIAPDAASIGKVQTFEEGVEIEIEIGAHDAPPFDSARQMGSVSCRPSLPRGCAAPARRPSPSRLRARRVERARLTPVTVSVPRRTARPIASRIVLSPYSSSSA